MFTKKKRTPADEIIDSLIPTYKEQIKPIAIKMDILIQEGHENGAIYAALDEGFTKLLIPFNEVLLKGMVEYPEHHDELKEYIVAKDYETRDLLIEAYIKEHTQNK